MDTVRSADGTTIAFEHRGSGPAVILVGGAFSDHTTMTATAALLTGVTTYCYDRRGRGASGDAHPHAPEREFEDLAALVAHAGGTAAVFGHSSGAVLALEAAARGVPITRLAVYEPSYIVGDSRPRPPADYRERLASLIAAGRRADVVRLFLRESPGLPDGAIDTMQGSPAWSLFESLAHVTDHDIALHGPGQSMSAERLAQIAVPTLVLAGSESEAWVHDTARAVAAAVPGAEHRTLAGQDHGVLRHPAALAPVLQSHLA